MPWGTCGQEKEFRLKGFISLEEINLFRQKQKYRFYLFDKSLYFTAKHVIYESKGSQDIISKKYCISLSEDRFCVSKQCKF